MLITLTIASILVIAFIAWLANRLLLISVCPVCAGAFLTWVGLMIAYFAGYQIQLIIPALLMGGSVVGIASQLEKKCYRLPVNTRVLWKAVFIPTGFVTAYALLEQQWIVFVVASGVLVVLAHTLVSLRKATRMQEEAIKTLEEQMKECC